MKATALRDELKRKQNPEKGEILQRFFKTGPGQYGEGDIFWGLTVPETRAIVAKFPKMPLEEIELLLIDPVHEVRLAAGILLVNKFKKATNSERQAIYEFYIVHASRFNNWDLVDVTCPQIVGVWLLDKDRKQLYELAASSNLWEQRISIVSTFALIRNNDFEDCMNISKMLLNHKHDLIQKAVGWMLREMGKRNFLVETEFLIENDRYKTMPRTMLRYAIEKYPEHQRQAFLKGEM
ncbi:MAG TPA: DNA alkylation repair protein [Bacteroidales bacterium]|nr:DNA alkylation repair protein [Bacteroidales bacterium]